MRIILHVDLDAFFPSVEVREHPELKDKPVVVRADPKEPREDIVSSASYDARKFGIRSALPKSRPSQTLLKYGLKPVIYSTPQNAYTSSLDA